MGSRLDDFIALIIAGAAIEAASEYVNVRRVINGIGVLWSDVNRDRAPSFRRIIAREDSGHGLQVIFALAFAAFAGSQTGDDMSLRRADAVAAIAFGRKSVIMRPPRINRRLRVAVIVKPDAAIAGEPDFAAVAFDNQFFRDRFAPRGAADAVGVD